MMLECKSCGTTVKAGCTCGVAYVPVAWRAAKAVAADPTKSDRAIAAEIGVNRRTVVKARAQLVHSAPVEKRTGKATVSRDTVEKRTGRDGKSRKVPAAKPNNIVPFEQRPAAISAAMLSRFKSLCDEYVSWLSEADLKEAKKCFAASVRARSRLLATATSARK